MVKYTKGTTTLSANKCTCTFCWNYFLKYVLLFSNPNSEWNTHEKNPWIYSSHAMTFNEGKDEIPNGGRYS